MDVSVELCNAAAEGDVPRMKALIENGANPNAGDYDDRTGLFSPHHQRILPAHAMPSVGRRRLLLVG